MARIDVVKMFQEAPAFIFKNLDILGLYILTVLPGLVTNTPSPLINIKELPLLAYFGLWAVMGLYGALVWLTLVTTILTRLKHKAISLLGAFKHVWKQLFTKGAWWYLLFYLCVYYGQAMWRLLLANQSASVMAEVSVLTFVLTTAAMYYPYIIVDDYRSINDTVIKSLRYVKESIIPFLKIILFTLLIVSPFVGIFYVMVTIAKIPMESMQGSALMIAFTGVSFLVGFVYSIVWSKLYLQLKAND